jgi:hypothetical protein
MRDMFWRKMKLIQAFIMVLLTAGCNPEISGIVVDAETGKPIEGAVVLVEWGVTKGLPGMTYTESYKVAELVSDKDGKVTLPEAGPNPLANPPNLTVYKRGYVAWNNRYIFSDFRERKDFRWEDGFVFHLEKFKPEHTHNAHSIFISSVVGVSALEKKQLMLKAVHWEREKAFLERQIKERK